MLLMPDTSDQAAAHKFLTYSYVACGLLWIGVAILAVSADKTRYGTVVGLSSIGITPLIIASYFCGQNQKTDYLSLTRSSIFLCMGVAVCASALTWLITIYLALAFGKANDVTNDGQFLVAFVAVYFLTSVPALLLLSWRTAPKSVLAMICVFALLFLQGALNYLGFSPLIAILQHYGIAHMKGSVTLTISEARCIGVNNTYPGFCRLSVGSSPEQDTKLPKQKASKKDTEDLTTNSTSYGIIQGNEMRSRFGDNLLIGVDRRPVDTGPLQKLKTNAGAELSEKQLDGLYTVFVSIPKKDILACTIISGSKIRLDEYKDISIEVLPKKVLKPCI